MCSKLHPLLHVLSSLVLVNTDSNIKVPEKSVFCETAPYLPTGMEFLKLSFVTIRKYNLKRYVIVLFFKKRLFSEIVYQRTDT